MPTGGATVHCKNRINQCEFKAINSMMLIRNHVYPFITCGAQTCSTLIIGFEQTLVWDFSSASSLILMQACNLSGTQRRRLANLQLISQLNIPSDSFTD